MAAARLDVLRLYRTVVFSVRNGERRVQMRAVRLFSQLTSPTPVPAPGPGSPCILNGASPTCGPPPGMTKSGGRSGTAVELKMACVSAARHESQSSH